MATKTLTVISGNGEETQRMFNVCDECNEVTFDIFMLKDELWNSLGYNPNSLICLKCCFKKLKEQNVNVTKDIFTDAPCNNLAFATLGCPELCKNLTPRNKEQQ